MLGGAPGRRGDGIRRCPSNIRRLELGGGMGGALSQNGHMPLLQGLPLPQDGRLYGRIPRLRSQDRNPSRSPGPQDRGPSRRLRWSAAVVTTITRAGGGPAARSGATSQRDILMMTRTTPLCALHVTRNQGDEPSPTQTHAVFFRLHDLRAQAASAYRSANQPRPRSGGNSGSNRGLHCQEASNRPGRLGPRLRIRAGVRHPPSHTVGICHTHIGASGSSMSRPDPEYGAHSIDSKSHSASMVGPPTRSFWK